MSILRTPLASIAMVGCVLATTPPSLGITTTTSQSSHRSTLMTTPTTRDRDAIQHVLDTITRGADLHQWHAVRAAFADRVILDYGTPETLSPDDIVHRWQPLLESFDRTEHALSDLTIDVDGDRADVRSSFVATHVMRGVAGGDTWTLEGRYVHALARGPEGWRVMRMTMSPGESSGNMEVLREAQRRAADPSDPQSAAMTQ